MMIYDWYDEQALFDELIIVFWVRVYRKNKNNIDGH